MVLREERGRHFHRRCRGQRPPEKRGVRCRGQWPPCNIEKVPRWHATPTTVTRGRSTFVVHYLGNTHLYRFQTPISTGYETDIVHSVLMWEVH